MSLGYRAALTLILFTSLNLSISSSNAFAINDSVPYYGDGLYQKIDQGLRGKELKTELYNILRSYHLAKPGFPDELVDTCKAKGRKSDQCYKHKFFSYRQARRYMFGNIHLYENQAGKYAITTVYCGREIVGQKVGPDQIPNPQVVNAEHTWPQSRFNRRQSKDLQKSDLHALFPTLSPVNSSRSNLELAWVDKIVGKQNCADSRRGYSNSSDRTMYFEPRDEHKGNAARALFYFSTRYNLRMNPIEESSLREWHDMDPVDAIERERQEEVFAVQKVRNPYIDHPELVEMISDF